MRGLNALPTDNMKHRDVRMFAPSDTAQSYDGWRSCVPQADQMLGRLHLFFVSSVVPWEV